MSQQQPMKTADSYDLLDETATWKFGELLAEQLQFPGIIYLYGQLGAGKTTLTRALLRGFGYPGVVKSPTYTLVEEYRLGAKKLFHFDLYRLADPEELEYIGVRDYFRPDALCVLEWPERGRGIIPDPDLEVKLQPAGDGRRVSLTAYSEDMLKALASLKKKWSRY